MAGLFVNITQGGFHLVGSSRNCPSQKSIIKFSVFEVKWRNGYLIFREIEVLPFELTNFAFFLPIFPQFFRR